MNFRKRHSPDEPEINFIPLIDVLLVIIIFLMLTTTYSRFSGIEITLPSADKTETLPQDIQVGITASEEVSIEQKRFKSSDISAIREALMQAKENLKEPFVVINADAKTSHQSVIDVMQAAQQADLPRISFATQAPAK